MGVETLWYEDDPLAIFKWIFLLDFLLRIPPGDSGRAGYVFFISFPSLAIIKVKQINPLPEGKMANAWHIYQTIKLGTLTWMEHFKT